MIGGGPAGLTAALYLSRGKTDNILLEQELAGGSAAMAPWIENYPGFPEGIAGVDLVEKIKQQADRFGLEIKTFAKATRVTIEGPVKTIELENGSVQARAIIVATGRRPQKVGIPGEEEFAGRGISYCATCDGPLFKDKQVMVIGGGDAAVGEALHLTRFASKVVLVHRRDQLRASTYLQERALSDPRIDIMWNNEIDKVSGEQVVTSASLRNNVTGERKEIAVSGIFFYVGNIPNTDFLSDVIELDKNGYIVTDENLETSVPGIFAAGDVRVNRFKQVIIAASEGALASAGAESYLERTGAKESYPGGVS